jgi:hypothetical protein
MPRLPAQASESPVDAARAEYLTSGNSSMPHFEPSRPMPLCFMPPNGRSRPGFQRDDALVDADDAVFEPLGDAPDAADVAAIEIGGDPLPNPPPQAGEGRMGSSVFVR